MSASPPRLYACETKILSGLGCISQLPQELKTYKISNPTLVVDAGIANAGLLEEWLPPEVLCLFATKVPAPTNPDLDAVRKSIEIVKDRPRECDGVVIIGGGSAICLGKAVALMVRNEGDILEYEGNGKMVNLPLPTFVLPTTAGSGSEVSRVLVLHEPHRPREIVVRGFGTEPRVALLDGNLLISCPRKPLLDAALDALSHACESLWSRQRNLFTDALAEKALETLLAYMPAAINDRNPEALQRILEASSAANLACGNTGLGLIHALTMSPDVKLAHGYQNGCLLLAVVEFNRACLEPRHRELMERLPGLCERVEWKGRFGEGELGDEEAELMVRASKGNPFRGNNGRESTDEECYEIIRASGAKLSKAIPEV